MFVLCFMFYPKYSNKGTYFYSRAPKHHLLWCTAEGAELCEGGDQLPTGRALWEMCVPTRWCVRVRCGLTTWGVGAPEVRGEVAVCGCATGVRWESGSPYTGYNGDVGCLTTLVVCGVDAHRVPLGIPDTARKPLGHLVVLVVKA
jgi:hypothetical protein